MTYKAKVFLTTVVRDIEAKDKDDAMEQAGTQIYDILKEYGIYCDFDIDCIDVDEVTP